MKDVLWQGRSANVENMLIERVCRTCPVSRLRSASPRTSVARVASFCTTIVTSIEIVAAPKRASNSKGIEIALRFVGGRAAGSTLSALASRDTTVHGVGLLVVEGIIDRSGDGVLACAGCETWRH